MNILEVEEARNSLVVKSNILIQKSRYSLNARQFDCVIYIVSQINKNDDRNKIYTLSINDICQTIGINPRDGGYAKVKSILDAIDKLRVWIPIGDKEVRIKWFNVLRMISGEGTVQVSFAEDIKDFVFELKNRFTKYFAEMCFVLNNKYSKYIYEYCKSIEFKGSEIVDMEKFSSYICPNGYKDYKDIRRWILDIAKEEINRLTDIKIDYKPISIGSRKTTHLEFTVEKITDEDELLEHKIERTKALPYYPSNQQELNEIIHGNPDLIDEDEDLPF